jgi:hypothetical protein
MHLPTTKDGSCVRVTLTLAERSLLVRLCLKHKKTMPSYLKHLQEEVAMLDALVNILQNPPEYQPLQEIE